MNKPVIVMQDILDEFRTELQQLGYCKNIVDNYPKHVKALFEHSHQLITTIESHHIEAFYFHLKTVISSRRKKPLSNSYIHSQLFAIRLFFAYLLRTKQLIKTPYTLKIKRSTYKSRAVLSVEQIALLYSNCINLEETMILNLCYGCGLRRTEVERLCVEDIHLSEKRLYVRSGKGKKRRVIPLTTKLVEDFKLYQDKTKNRRNDESILLLNSNGKPMSGNKIYTVFCRVLTRCGLDKQGFSLHNLRHSIASHLLENEMTVEMVRDFLGHDLLRTTQIYTKIKPYDFRKLS